MSSVILQIQPDRSGLLTRICSIYTIVYSLRNWWILNAISVYKFCSGHTLGKIWGSGCPVACRILRPCCNNHLWDIRCSLQLLPIRGYHQLRHQPQNSDPVPCNHCVQHQQGSLLFKDSTRTSVRSVCLNKNHGQVRG